MTEAEKRAYQKGYYAGIKRGARQVGPFIEHALRYRRLARGKVGSCDACRFWKRGGNGSPSIKWGFCQNRESALLCGAWAENGQMITQELYSCVNFSARTPS